MYDLFNKHPMASVMTSVQSELQLQKLASPTLVRSRPNRKGKSNKPQTRKNERSHREDDMR